MNVSVSADALIRVARGFSCIFWGIPLSLLLFSGKLDIRLFSFVRMPAYVLGIFLAYIGTVFLQRAGALSDMWTRRVRQALFLLLVEVYLAPFVYWWRQMPHVPYFTANMAGLVLCTTWGLFVVNRLAGEVCKLLHDRTFFIETQVAGWLTAGFMITPLAHALYYCGSRGPSAGRRLLLHPRSAVVDLRTGPAAVHHHHGCIVENEGAMSPGPENVSQGPADSIARTGP